MNTVAGRDGRPARAWEQGALGQSRVGMRRWEGGLTQNRLLVLWTPWRSEGARRRSELERNIIRHRLQEGNC